MILFVPNFTAKMLLFNLKLFLVFQSFSALAVFIVFFHLDQDTLFFFFFKFYSVFFLEVCMTQTLLTKGNRGEMMRSLVSSRARTRTRARAESLIGSVPYVPRANARSCPWC